MIEKLKSVLEPLRTVIAQLEQAEPVATTAADHTKNEIGYCKFHAAVSFGTKLYTAPVQPKSEPLTDDEIQQIYFQVYNDGFSGRSLETAFARAIEAKHGIKD